MGKGSKLVKGGSWMSKHVKNLLTEMPIDNRASGKGAAEYGKMKGPGKHHEGGPMKHGIMHDGPGEYGKMKGPGKHGMHGPMAPGDTKKKSTDLTNVDVKAPKNVTITKGFITNPGFAVKGLFAVNPAPQLIVPKGGAEGAGAGLN